MRRARKAGWMMFVTLLMGCRADRLSNPDVDFTFRKPVADLMERDPCIYDATRFCHGNPVVWSYFSEGGVSYGDPAYECPDGCSTYNPGTSMRNLIRSIISNNIKSDPECSWAVTYLTAAVNYNKIRYYDTDWGTWGDSHWTPGQTSPYSSWDIHIWSNTFSNTYDLGRNLIHEAAHIRWEIPQERDMEASEWATRCFKF
jgi:hypothetical protein